MKTSFWATSFYVGVIKESEELQVNSLLYYLRIEAEDILTSANNIEDDRKQYDMVMAKFYCLFTITKNVIIECRKFNKHLQLPDEPAKQFIVSLYNLVTDRNFRDQRN